MQTGVLAHVLGGRKKDASMQHVRFIFLLSKQHNFFSMSHLLVFSSFVQQGIASVGYSFENVSTFFFRDVIRRVLLAGVTDSYERFVLQNNFSQGCFCVRTENS